MKIIITPWAKFKIQKKYKKENGKKARVDFAFVYKTMESIITKYASEYPEKSVFIFVGSNGLDAGNTPFSSEKAYIMDFYWMHLYNACFGKSPHKEQVFAETLGHEMGHSKLHPVCDLFHMVKILLGKKTGKAAFIFQTVEVYCDFNGKRILGLSNEEAGEVFKEKEDLYKSVCKKYRDTGDLEHPSHARRHTYISEYDVFGTDVIEAVAADIGYTDRAVIEDTCKRYQSLNEGGKYGDIWAGRIAYLASSLLLIMFVFAIPMSLFAIVALILVMFF